MRNKLYHRFVDLKSIPYFLDYAQLYFRLPIDQLEEIDGFNLKDCKTWLNSTAFFIHDQVSRNKIQGIRIGNPTKKYYADLINYGIKIYFEGSFFKGKKLKDDIIKLEKWMSDIQTQIIECQYNPNMWLINETKFIRNLVKVKFPELYLSRLDVSQNLYFDQFPNGLEKNPYKFAHNGSKKSPDFKNITFEDEDSTQKTATSVGNRKHIMCSVYNKKYDQDGHVSALDRFKTINFWRREWKIGKRKLKSMRFNLSSQLLQLKKYRAQKLFIASMRSAVDIVMHDDKSPYTIFHHTHIDRHTYNDLKKDCLTGARRLAYILKLKQSYDNALPQYETKYQKWNGSKNVLGIIKGYRDKWSSDEWFDILNELMKSPERLPIFNDHNYKHVDIQKVKNFLSELSYR